MGKNKVSDYSEQIRGVSYKPEDLHDRLDDNSVVLLRANNISDGEINFEDIVYVDKSKVSKKQLLRKGDIIVCASSGSKHLVGKAAQVDFSGGFTFGAFCKVVRPVNINYYYLGMYFQSSEYRRIISSISQGANINNIKNENIDNLMIKVPGESEQINVAEILIKVSKIIKLKRKQLDSLDELIKSRFVEMFGDPYSNLNKWDIKKLSDLSIKITDGVHAKPEYLTEGKPFISVVNITKGYVDFTNCKYVSEEAYQKMVKSTYPEKGDVLYTKVGATYGIPAYVDTYEEFCLYVSVCLIKPIHEKINARFLAISMGMPYVKMQADSRIKGIGVPDLHLNQIREFDIVCPPIEKQLEFVTFVQQVDKLKVV